METSVSDIAREILGIIPDRQHWIKGQYGSLDGRRHCVAGALYTLSLSRQQQAEFGQAFCTTAVEQYPEIPLIHYGAYCGGIPKFNDHPRVGYRDIRRILEKLAAQED